MCSAERAGEDRDGAARDLEGLPFRSRLAVRVARALNAVSRLLGRGQGTVIGGTVALAIDPNLVAEITRDRDVALVSGTNGKTTTTKLLVAALESDSSVSVVTNSTGSNMPAGHLGALIDCDRRALAVLEVDEGYLGDVLRATRPRVVVLLNLSRDQLDRSNEVRMMAQRWRAALRATGDADDWPHESVVVANVDDPLVVYAAEECPEIIWVAAGQRWRLDSTGCPKCAGRIVYNETSTTGGDLSRAQWGCACGFVRPEPDAWIVEESESSGLGVVLKGSEVLPITLSLPGRFNYSNALMALSASSVLGVPAKTAVLAMDGIDEVAGRYSTRLIGGVPTRCLLAKNPAGWEELLDIVAVGNSPIVIGINARIADGTDPSWLWDVAFESLGGRRIVATGERRGDLAVRLHYAGVDHEVVRDPMEAICVARDNDGRSDVEVEFIANYTLFHEVIASSRGSRC